MRVLCKIFPTRGEKSRGEIIRHIVSVWQEPENESGIRRLKRHLFMRDNHWREVSDYFQSGNKFYNSKLARFLKYQKNSKLVVLFRILALLNFSVWKFCFRLIVNQKKNHIYQLEALLVSEASKEVVQYQIQDSMPGEISCWRKNDTCIQTWMQMTHSMSQNSRKEAHKAPF